MSEPFEIDLGIDNLLPATTAFKTIGEQLDALADRFDALIDKISAVTSQATQAAAALKTTATTRANTGGSGASGANGGAGAAKDPKLMVAEYQRMLDAQNNLNAAQGRGTASQIRDAELILRRRKEAVDKLTGMSAPEATKLMSGPHQRLEEARSNLQAAEKGGTQKQLADAELRVKRAEQELLQATGAASPLNVRTGPYQRLRELQEQQGRLGEISDPDRRADAKKDLDEQIFRARRGILSAEEHQRDPNSLLVPGLLSSFQTLNRLMTRLTDGNVIGALFSIGTLLRQHAPGGPAVGEILSGKFRQGADGGFMWGGAGTTSGAMGRMGAANGAASQGAAANAGGAAVSVAAGAAAGTTAKIGGSTVMSGGLSDFIVPGAEGAVAGSMIEGMAAALLPLLTNPITIAVAVMAAAALATAFVFKKIYDAASAAADAIRSLANAAIVTGGTFGETASLQAMGLSPDQMTSVADQLRQTITAGSGDKFAMMAAAQLGIGPMGPQGLGVGTDSAKILEETIKKIGSMGSAEERLMYIRRLHLETIAREIEAYSRIGKQMDADAALRNKYSGPYVKAAQDFGDQQMRLKTNWDTLTQAFAAPSIQAFSGNMKEWNDILADLLPAAAGLGRILGLWVNYAITLWTKLADVVDIMIQVTWTVDKWIEKFTILGWVFKNLEKLLNITGDKHDQAADKQMQAADQQAKNAQAFNNGIMGGGDRARGAIPSGLRGEALRRTLDGGSLRAGAFAL